MKLFAPFPGPVAISRLSGLILLLVVSASLDLAQISTGTIAGIVQDDSGAVIANASVTLTHTATGELRQAGTNDHGEFNAPFIPLGTYTVRVAAPGFETKVLSGIELLVDQTANLHIVLSVGSVSQTVDVASSAPLVDSVTSSLGQVIENKQILDMPLNGRNPFALGLLVGDTTPVFGMGSNLPFIAGGGRFSAIDVSLDGVDNNTISNAGAIGRNGIAVVPSVDAIQEFKVKTNNFSAEFGHAAGSIVSATLKSGTNQFHGTLFEFLRNDQLDANNFFTNAAGKPRTPFHQNQFGGVLGGPVVRNHTFFFADYQGTRQSSTSGSSISDVPPTAFRAGDFSQSKTVIYDPGTRHLGASGTVIATPFPNNVIPSSELNPTSLAILSLLPLPNFGTPGAVARNYFYQPAQFSNTDQGDLRMDQIISAKNSLFGSFSISENSQPAIGTFPGFIGGGASSVNNAAQAALDDIHSFTPALVNELRLGYIRHNGSLYGTGQEGVAFAQKAGLPLFPAPVEGFPNINFFYSGGQSGSAEFSSWGGGDPNLNIETRLQLADNISYTHGGHALKFGVDIRRERFDTLKGTPFFGETIFGAIFTSSSNAPGSGLPFADYLLGDPAFISGSPMINWGRQRDLYFGGYGQDDWKLSKRLTLNLGLRYELYTQPVDAGNLGSLFNIQTGQYVIPGTNGFSRAIVNGDHNNFGPRFGFAYQATSKFVVRGGYGIFYAERDQNQQVTQFSGNPPNVPTVSLPNVSATQTISPPFTINTPITTVPTDVSLKSFTAQNPYVGTFRTQSFNNARDPMLHQYNLDLQYQATTTLLLEASYSGALGRDLASLFLNSNQVPFSSALNGTNIQADRPFPNINGSVLTIFSTATSDYNALNLKVEKRYSSGFNLLANYTWQKNMESGGSGPDAYTQNGGTSIALDTYNLSKERSVAPINVGQDFTVSAGYELPFGPGKPMLARRGVLSTLAGGWVVNGILTLRGGFPTDIRTNVLPPVFNTFNVASCVSGEPMEVSNPGVNAFFNPAAFTVPGTTLSTKGAVVQEFGNCARRVATGPGSKNLDLSLFKNFFFTERIYLQFRAEFFNATNTPTFYLPAASSPTLTCIGPPGAACNANNPSFGQLSSASATGRQIQFGLKLYF
jgi:Carboxypeptidase regulatory-like domain/TonB dependent receptor